MKHKQVGFTLIELVMVIVVLGILAVVAVPQFVDLSGSANTAAEQGVGASISSATINNYAICETVTSGGGISLNPLPASVPCTILNANLIQFVGGLTVADWTITPGATAGTTAVTPTKGKMGTCILTHNNTNITPAPTRTIQVMGTRALCK